MHLNTKKWFVAMAVAAFISFILLINQSSYFADKHDVGWLFLGGGILFAVCAVYILIAKVIKGSNT